MAIDSEQIVCSVNRKDIGILPGPPKFFNRIIWFNNQDRNLVPKAFVQFFKNGIIYRVRMCYF